MLNKFIQYLISFSSWPVSQWAFALVMVLLIFFLAHELPSILRLAMVPFILMEVYFMSTLFACGGSLNMFSRAYGTQTACNPLDYNRYLSSNFGFEHWYVLVGYIGLLVFMIWPIFSKIAYANQLKRELIEQNQASVVSADKYLEFLEKANKTGRIGSI